MSHESEPHVPGTLYHLFSRGNHRQIIFQESNDYRRFLHILPIHLNRHGITLYGYCLMPTHFHLLIRLGNVPLGTFMQSLLLSFAKWWNLKYRQRGHLFQGRYHHILCEQDRYLMALIRYIHFNSVKDGFVKHPGEWPWSSWFAYMERPIPWLDSQGALQLLDPHPARAMKRFKELMKNDASPSLPSLWKIKQGRYVINESSNPRVLPQRMSPVDHIPRMNGEAFINWASQTEGVPMAHLLGRQGHREVVRLRVAIAYALRLWWGWNGVNIAQYLQRTRSAISLMQTHCEPSPPREISKILDRWKSLFPL